MLIKDASYLAQEVDKTFIFISIIAFIFIIGITGFMIYTVIRYSRKRVKQAKQFSGSLAAELIWTIVPLVLVILMFWYGLVPYKKMRNVPEDAMNITAIGRMWQWEFDYGDSMRSKELVVPLNKAIKINLKSEDVNHSLFIPAFRVKEDAIPGYNNYLWFIATIPGEYEILCTEYCGLLHSAMLSKARVLEQEEYDQWFSDFKNQEWIPEPDGYLLLRNTGCIACHSLDGTRLVGPSFKGLFGQERMVLAGNTAGTVIADEQYITKSIYDPDAEIVQGYNKGLMKSYTGVIEESDIQIIIDYLKTLAEVR